MANTDGRWHRRYLLGELTEPERDEAEERLLRDADILDELDQAEDELVEGFLRGSLGPQERERFEDHFLASARHRRQLAAAGAMREHFLAQLAAEARTPARPARQVMLAAAAVLILALAAARWWSRGRNAPPDVPRQASGGTVPRSEPPSPPEPAVVLRLRPGQTMGSEAARPQAILTPASQTLRLELALEQDVFDSYQARLSTPEGERWRVEHLRPLRTRDGSTVVVEVPVRQLGPSPSTDYRVRLFGERDGSEVQAVASYSFRVSGPRHSP